MSNFGAPYLYNRLIFKTHQLFYSFITGHEWLLVGQDCFLEHLTALLECSNHRGDSAEDPETLV